MGELHYRVIADRDKGDDMTVPTQQGDRVTWEWTDKHVIEDVRHDELVRIERPVPTEHCLSTAQHDGHEWAAHANQPGTGYWCPGSDAAEEHPPTREQIDEAMVERAARALFEGADGISPGDYSWDDVVHHDGTRAHLWRADARHVLQAALFQNAADQ